MQFHNIWTVYFDFLDGRYVPSVGRKSADEVIDDSTLTTEMGPTLMFLLYAFFFSLIEDSDDGLDAFRIWRKKYPGEGLAIAALEEQIVPLRPNLRVFRNRLGFHGSRTYQHESKGFDLFANHSGTKLIQAMKLFKALNAALLEQNLAQQENSTERLKEARSRIDLIAERCRAMSQL